MSYSSIVTFNRVGFSLSLNGLLGINYLAVRLTTVCRNHTIDKIADFCIILLPL